MTRESEWQAGQFALLLVSPGLPDEEVAAETGRSAGAVAVVREGVCLYHRGMETHGILAGMMLDFLDKRRGHLECERCKTQF